MLRTPDEVMPRDGEELALPRTKQRRETGPVRGLQELVGVKGHDPIGAELTRRQSQQAGHVLTLSVAYRGLTNNHQGQSCELQLLQGLVGAIRTAIIEHDMEVEGMSVVTDKRFDDVQFILHAANRD